MTCHSCAKARTATLASVKAALRGDHSTAKAKAAESGTHIADKARAESERD